MFSLVEQGLSFGNTLTHIYAVSKTRVQISAT